MLMPNGPAAWVGLELGAKAGVHAPTSACATGAEAIAWALDILRAGRADIVVAGGTEAVIHPLPVTASTEEGKPMTTRDEITSGLAEILEEVAGVNPDDVAEGKSFTDDLDVDSLSMVEVVVAAEEKFGVKIPDDEVQNLKTVGDAVSYIEKASA